MSSILDAIKVLAPTTGAVVGGLIGGPAGAAIGSGAGGVLSGGLSLFDQPNTMGASPEMVMAFNRADATASRLASGQGLSDTVYTRALQSGISNAQAQVGNEIAALRETSGRISPLTVSGIADKMLAAPIQIQKTEDKLLSMDIEQEINNLKASIAADNSSSNMATNIYKADKAKEIEERKIKDARMANFAKSVSEIAKGIALLPVNKKQSIGGEAPDIANIKIPDSKITDATAGVKPISGTSITDPNTPTIQDTNLYNNSSFTNEDQDFFLE